MNCGARWHSATKTHRRGPCPQAFHVRSGNMVWRWRGPGAGRSGFRGGSKTDGWQIWKQPLALPHTSQESRSFLLSRMRIFLKGRFPVPGLQQRKPVTRGSPYAACCRPHYLLTHTVSRVRWCRWCPLYHSLAGQPFRGRPRGTGERLVHSNWLSGPRISVQPMSVPFCSLGSIPRGDAEGGKGYRPSNVKQLTCLMRQK